MDLLELDQGVDPAQHWYYRTKADSMLRALRRTSIRPNIIKDVGAGSGFFSTVALEAYPAARAVCVDPHYPDEQLQQSSDRLRFVREDRSAADVYLFMDVLEHVQDDVALLSEYVAEAPAGAVFFVSVPAIRYLWSGHDVFLGHFRRYTLTETESVVRDAGLRPVTGRYLYGATFPAVAAVRLAQRGRAARSDMRPARPLLNAALSGLLRAENRLPANRLAGSTAVVLAVRERT